MLNTVHDGHAVQDFIGQFGLALGRTQVELVDVSQAETCYIHHSQMPVAVAGYAMASPTFARGRFPKTTFIELIQKRPAMDQKEVIAFAGICGINVTPPFWGNGAPFAAQLWAMIERYELGDFFERLNGTDQGNGDHVLMRPRGIDWSDPNWPEVPAVIDAWRKSYKKLPMARQLMVATILQLYRQGEDRVWMVRVPKKWLAADGIAELQEQGMLADWARLFALYPGW